MAQWTWRPVCNPSTWRRPGSAPLRPLRLCPLRPCCPVPCSPVLHALQLVAPPASRLFALCPPRAHPGEVSTSLPLPLQPPWRWRGVSCLWSLLPPNPNALSPLPLPANVLLSLPEGMDAWLCLLLHTPPLITTGSLGPTQCPSPPFPQPDCHRPQCHLHCQGCFAAGN